jgi:hypothetical protein
MNNHLSNFARHRLRRRKTDTAHIAAQLAPLEEQKKLAVTAGDGNGLDSPLAHQEVGAIVVEGKAGSFSKEIAEAREDTKRRGLEPVVLVILVVILSFIAFVAWQISLMSEK